MTRAARLPSLLVVAACGGGGGMPADAPAGADAPPQPDAPVDAVQIDAAPDAPDPADRVDITVLNRLGDGGPDTNAIVIFTDPSGIDVQDGLTDAMGQAYAYLPDGGSVTVLQVTIEGATRYVGATTIRGVQPGDQLRAGGERAIRHETGATDTMTATYTPPVGATSAGVFTACANGVPNGMPNQATLTFWESCVTPTFALVGVADDATGRRVLWQPTNTHVPDGTVALTGTWELMTAATVTFDNVPGNLSRVVARWHTMVDAYPWETDFRTVELPSAGSHTVNPLYPAAAGNGTMVHSFTVRGIQPIEEYVVATDSIDGAVTIDYASLPVPRPTSQPEQSDTGVSWTPTGGGAPDARVIKWQGRFGAATGTIHEVFWIIYEDPSDPPMTMLPRLPVQYEQDDPQTALPGDLNLQGAYVDYLDYDNLAGWDEARPYGPALDWISDRFLGVPHRAHVTRGP